MDEQLRELETELKRLRPRAPSAALVNRLEHELKDQAPVPGAAVHPSRRFATATGWSTWQWFGWPAIAAAAAVALIAVGGVRLKRRITPDVSQNASVPPVTMAQSAASARLPVDYEPVSAANVLYDLRDEGAVSLDDSTPARQLRYRYLDTYTWKNPKSNASLQWSFPRDEIRVVPASYR